MLEIFFECFVAKVLCFLKHLNLAVFTTFEIHKMEDENQCCNFAIDE